MEKKYQFFFFIIKKSDFFSNPVMNASVYIRNSSLGIDSC